MRYTRRALAGIAVAFAFAHAAGTLAGAVHAAQPFPARIALPDGFQPEGIATGRGPVIYAGSIASGAVYAADLRTGEGTLLVQPSPGSVAIGLEFDRRTNVFDKQATETLALRDEAAVNANELFCVAEAGGVSCLIRGDRFIFDARLAATAGRLGLTVATRYPFAESYFIESKLNYALTPKYLAVLTKNSAGGYDGLVFRRDAAAKVNKVFGAVRVKDDERIARIGLVDGTGDAPSRLFVALFLNRVETSSLYHNLVVDEYQFGPFGLDIARDSAGYHRTLELNFVSRDNEIKKVHLSVVLNSNFKNFMLTIILLILVAVLVGLVMAVFSVYHRNRKLRMEVDPNVADQSAFVNRTQFQI